MMKREREGSYLPSGKWLRWHKPLKRQVPSYEGREADVELRNLIQKHTLLCLAGGFAIGICTFGVGSAMMSVSGSPAFCGSCHSMKHEAWTFADPAHSQLECADCHLPHQNVAIYLVEKGRTGMVDTYHEVLRDYPAHIKISKDGWDTVNANCVRCHEPTMDNVHADLGKDFDSGGDCLKCHSRIAHGTNHLEGGIKVE